MQMSDFVPLALSFCIGGFLFFFVGFAYALTVDEIIKDEAPAADRENGNITPPAERHFVSDTDPQTGTVTWTKKA